MDGGAWWAAVHGVAEGRTQLSDFTFTSHFHALEKEVATHSSVLAWRTPGMGEPGGLQSMGSYTTEQLSTQHKKSRTRSFLAGAKWPHSPSVLNLLFPLGGSLYKSCINPEIQRINLKNILIDQSSHFITQCYR